MASKETHNVLHDMEQSPGKLIVSLLYKGHAFLEIYHRPSQKQVKEYLSCDLSKCTLLHIKQSPNLHKREHMSKEHCVIKLPLTFVFDN